MADNPGKVLVVDDDPINLQLLGQILNDRYQLSFATSGAKALEVAGKVRPDLILLDIMMPGMDGYETCRRLKADPQTSGIPVIFVTAKEDEADEWLGFKVEAVDYITKPVKSQILRARVHTHLELKKARDELEQKNEVLRENVRLREDIQRITQHDLKSPLTGILAYPELVISMGNLSEKQEEYLHKTIQVGYKILNMINLSLDLYKMEQKVYQFQPVLVDILPLITDILQENQGFILSKKLTAEILINDHPISAADRFKIPGEKLLFYSMLMNLIKNSLEASPAKAKIAISLRDGNNYHIRIYNSGAVPENIRNTFFNKYSTSGKPKGTGLGTYSAKLIAETQGGQIALDTSKTDGTTIHIWFPKSQ